MRLDITWCSLRTWSLPGTHSKNGEHNNKQRMGNRWEHNWDKSDTTRQRGSKAHWTRTIKMKQEAWQIGRRRQHTWAWNCDWGNETQTRLTTNKKTLDSEVEDNHQEQESNISTKTEPDTKPRNITQTQKHTNPESPDPGLWQSLPQLPPVVCCRIFTHHSWILKRTFKENDELRPYMPKYPKIKFCVFNELLNTTMYYVREKNVTPEITHLWQNLLFYTVYQASCMLSLWSSIWCLSCGAQEVVLLMVWLK